MPYTTIKKPSDYFNTVTYTGNGTTPRSITGVGFQPDLIWVKERTSTSEHQVVDNVRGPYHRLQTNSTSGEGTDSSPYSDFKSFDSDGWTMGDGGAINENTQTYAAWNWLASNTTASNTDGSITSTVSVNTTSGFSIVSYTGNGTANSTIGHGLGTVPDFIIVKNRTTTQSWGTKNAAYNSPSDPGVLYLNGTNTTDSAQNVWGTSASFTTSTFTVGDWTGSNESGSNFIAYCWSAKQGYSKFGKYIGNGSTDGTFVYTGFKPAFVLSKHASGGTAAGENWNIYDTARDPYNVVSKRIMPNSVNAESSGANDYFDILSNGFKLRNVDGRANNSGATYIYMAFAEEPLVGDNPATAR